MPSLGADPQIGRDDLALYVHWPFCLSKCPYCDFNSHVRERIDTDRWQRAYLRALRHAHAQTANRTVRSIFFGGGTPSLMPPSVTGAILDQVAALWTLDPQCEITLEANPGASDADRFAGFRAAGINRLSMGIQSFNDDELRFLGRAHDAATARTAIKTAMGIFDRVSFDLIYALPGQEPESWRRALREALAFGTEHLSLYQLTIEPGTQFATLYDRGALPVADEEMAEILFDITQSDLDEAGLPAYEISNHARPGASCRHNLTYWLYGDYAGIGPGAHGRLTIDGQRQATRAHRAPEAWLTLIEDDPFRADTCETIDPDAQLSELTLMGLRLRAGIPVTRFSTLFGKDPMQLYAPAKLDRLITGGFLVLDAEGLRATDAGRLRLNAVTASLL